MKTFIVIAAFNEEKKIAAVIEDLKKNGYKNIIVVDDGSEDNTFNKAKSQSVDVLRHVINRGQGAALKTGIDYALRKKADIIVTYDADGQFLAEEIEDVAAPIKENKADIVLGSRFLGKAKNIPPSKKIVLKLGVFVVRMLYGIKVTDSQCGFRALNKKAAQEIKITSDGINHADEFFSEIMRNKLKYMEVPITVIYDDYSLKKGQKWSRSIELGLNMVYRKFFR